MDRFLTPNSQSFEWDDFRWWDSSLRKGFYGLLSAFGIAPDESFIISGCEIVENAGNYEVSEGYIGYNGIVYKVPAHVVPIDPADTYYWDVVTTTDPSGTESDANGNTIDVYEVNYMELTHALGVPPPFMPKDAPTIYDIIREKSHPAWKHKNFGPGEITAPGWTVVDNSSLIKYQKLGKTVHASFAIVVDISGSGSGDIRFKLPHPQNLAVFVTPTYGVARVELTFPNSHHLWKIEPVSPDWVQVKQLAPGTGLINTLVVIVGSFTYETTA